MRKILIAAGLLFALTCESHAQHKTNNEPYQMMVDGVKVIVQPSGNEIVVVTTAIKGGVQNYKADKAGIEQLAVQALTECGTAKDDKNTFKDKLDQVSASIYGGAGLDYSTITLNCIKGDLDQVWPLYADALTRPRFDEKEFNRIKQDAINSIRASEGNPDFTINRLAMQTAFASKNYAIDPQGTAASITPLTAAATKKYWQSILTKSRMVIVVVADLDRTVIENKIKTLLAAVPAGQPFVLKKSTYSPGANTFKAEKRDNATNYVQGITSGPSQGTPEYNAFMLAMRIFSNKHFIEIRTNNGLSYAPGSWFSGGTTPYANIYVSTTNPNKYIAVARALIDRLKKNGFTAEELKNEKGTMLTEVYYRQETNSAMANSFIGNEIVHGNWKRSIQLHNEIEKVNLEQVNNAFRKYINNITWVYQGDPATVAPTMYTQKETPKIPEEKKAF